MQNLFLTFHGTMLYENITLGINFGYKLCTGIRSRSSNIIWELGRDQSVNLGWAGDQTEGFELNLLTDHLSRVSALEESTAKYHSASDASFKRILRWAHLTRNLG